ncbi:MAG TPA: hypothetical protein VFZ65_22340 [Planctomycetota bacterium]|nr:hypothetical protein [Planctomycetota bacterium]
MNTSLVAVLVGTILIGVGVTTLGLGSAPLVDTAGGNLNLVQVAADTAGPREHGNGTQILSGLPIAFVPNLGQWEGAASYVTRVGPMTVFLEERGWTFTLVEKAKMAETKQRANEDASARGVAVRMKFVGAAVPRLVAEDRLPGCHNYFLGNDPSRWRSNVPLYGAVRYRDVHPGIDVRARVHDGRFEYDLLLQADADLEPVEIAAEGIERMHLDKEGSLVMDTQLGPVRMPVPLSWEEGPSGERSLVACHYVLRGEQRFGFEVTGRRPGWALVVDPGILWSTFLGGMDRDQPNALALDAQGAVTVAGETQSTDFPTTPGAFDPSLNSPHDAFVTRLSPTGSTLFYSTFLGGTGDDIAYALAVDTLGRSTIAGVTSSLDFPTTPVAFSTALSGGGDAFVTRLSPTGSSLVYSTYIGGTLGDKALAIAEDAQGTATVVGQTDSNNFPITPGAFDTSHNGFEDAFVTRLTPTGSNLIYSTYLGGTDTDVARAVALDAQGAATVSGDTASTGFPTSPGVFDTTYNGGARDAFVTRLSPTGSSLIYSTFLGGTGHDEARAIALDAQGTATVSGFTVSGNFPTTPGAFDTSHNGGINQSDAFVTRISSTGASLVYSTFLGGANDEMGLALAVDTLGAATVVGWTGSTNFPTTSGAVDTTQNGGRDAFITRLSPTGASLEYSTFLGRAYSDGAYAIALDAQGAATVAGQTDAANFPITPGAFDTSFNGIFDAYITRLDMLPTGVVAFGNSSPGCTGPLAISVTSMPQVGNANFALTCGNAAPNTVGLIAFASAGLPAPLSVLGVDVWIDPTALLVTATVFSNPIGASEVPLPIPPNPTVAGVRLFTQFLWLGPNAPPPCPPLGFSASYALDFTIQP